MKYYLLAALLLFAFQAKAVDPVHIEVSKSYDGYTNEELKRRVWQLERAVSQLQDQVFQLALHDGSAGNSSIWTCQIQSFGKTLIASGNTKASALAQVLKKCSDATNAIHCSESDVKCGNE